MAKLTESEDDLIRRGRTMFAPFVVCREGDRSDQSSILFLSVRTTSWEWNGDRTDLHDVFSLVWAALLRATETASSHLISVNDGFGPSTEISSRILVLRQQGHSLSAQGDSVQELWLIKTAQYALRVVAAAFGLFGKRYSELCIAEAPAVEPDTTWVKIAIKQFRLDKLGYEYRSRAIPRWKSLTSIRGGVSAIEIEKVAAEKLKDVFRDFCPRVVETPLGTAFRTEYMANAVSSKALAKAKLLLALIEGKRARVPLIIPLDSHVLLIGRKCLISVASDGGRETFADHFDALQRRRDVESDVFMQDSSCVWSETVNDGRFEELIGALLEVEPGVHRVKKVGATREADDGRDYWVEWNVIPTPDKIVTQGDGATISEPRDVLVQVKMRKRGVNRGDMTGIRDTIEHHGCSGFLLVAYPQITSTLFDHLTSLRRQGRWWIEWWDKIEIEKKLRKNPDIAARFPDIVSLTRELARRSGPSNGAPDH